MAGRRQRAKFPIILELTPKGLFWCGIVCLCIFFWMFLLGIWAGQTILLPGEQINNGLGSPVLMPGAASETAPAVPRHEADITEPKTDGQHKVSAEPVDDESFFSLQVGAFSTEERARQTARTWLDRGYVAFYQAPAGEGDIYWRAFIGRFEELAEANALVEKLKKDENVKSFISLIPTSEVRKP